MIFTPYCSSNCSCSVGVGVSHVHERVVSCDVTLENFLQLCQQKQNSGSVMLKPKMRVVLWRNSERRNVR